MAKFGSKIHHIVILVLVIIGLFYIIHMMSNHQGSQIVPSLFGGK
jgi:hypothetical protein